MAAETDGRAGLGWEMIWSGDVAAWADGAKKRTKTRKSDEEKEDTVAFIACLSCHPK